MKEIEEAATKKKEGRKEVKKAQNGRPERKQKF